MVVVKSVTSLTGNGFRDWFIQRVSALVLGAYSVFLMVYVLMHQQLTYFEWRSLFNHQAMKMATFLALLSLVLHTWVGIWTVLTDYVRPRVVRMTLQVLINLSLLACLVWGLEILWSAS